MSLLEKQEQARKLEFELNILTAHLGDVNRENIVLTAQQLQKDDYIKTKTDLEKLLKISKEKKILLEERLAQATLNLEDSQTTSKNEINLILQEIQEILAEIEEVDKKYKIEQNTNNELKNSVNDLKIKLSNAQELKQKVQVTIEAYKAESNKRDELTLQLDSLTIGLEKQSNEIFSHQSSLIESKKAATEQIFRLEAEIQAKEVEILKLKTQLFEESAQKMAQEQVLCIRTDLAQLVEDLQKLHKLYDESRLHILRDLNAGSKILLEESEKVYIQAEKLDEMINAVDKKEEELDILKNKMGEVKRSNPPYVPVKDDLVDVALAEYLNSKETPLPIKFIRQDGGNYLFGTKKVYIKIENNRMLVKVGGGFTSVDEFLAIYTPVELERAENSPKGSPGPSSLAKYSKDNSPRSSIKRLSGNSENQPRSPRKSLK